MRERAVAQGPVGEVVGQALGQAVGGTVGSGGPERLAVEWLGCLPYRDALELQNEAVEARRSGAAGDRLLLLEHPPVITLGRGAKPENVLATPELLRARGIERHEVSRGGDVTYHAPGQLVGYLVSDLAQAAARRGLAPDAHRFLRSIEAALIEVTGELGVPGQTLQGMTGVFVARRKCDPAPPRKIASIGVGLRGWVSHHGFALNVTTDLTGFDTIVPCGLRGVAMTSLGRELADTGRAAGPPGAADLNASARRAVSSAFRRHFSPSERVG